MGWALATHGPRGYFYALVMQLPIFDLRLTVICVEILSGLCLVDSEAKKACSMQDSNELETSICTLTALLHIHVLCIMCISQCTSTSI